LGAYLMFRQYLIACAVVFVVLPLSTLAQDRNIYDACAIPREWQPALTERLKSLTEYQRAGEWQRVSDMVGPFFNQQNRTKYADMQRESLIANIRARPMIAFTPTDVTWSTAAFAYPLHKRWWYISGQGDFLTGSPTETHRAELIAYRYRGIWYFRPLVATAAPNKSLVASGGSASRK
jgi:hypothetical protein